jgi:hypothetical protein
MQFEIARELYTTKASITRRYRAIIGGNSAGTIITDGKDFDFLLALLKHHDRRSEKIGPGVTGFRIVSVPGAKCVWIRRLDGTETDVSFPRVIERLGFTDAQRARYDLTRTLRAEIAYQIDAARDTHARGLPRIQGGYHVDHDRPPFAQLIEGFLIEHRLDPATIHITHGERGEPCRLTDPDIATAWRAYHQQHATLRLLTADENLRRQTPKIDWKRVDEHVHRDSRRGYERMHDA